MDQAQQTQAWNDLHEALLLGHMGVARELCGILVAGLEHRELMPEISTMELAYVLRWLYDLTADAKIRIIPGPHQDIGSQLIRLMEAEILSHRQPAENVVAASHRLLNHIRQLEDSLILHPRGRCVCYGEGRCNWCLRMAAQERQHRLVTALQALKPEQQTGSEWESFLGLQAGDLDD